MRADRLISIILLLKQHGVVSAGRLAHELVVSRRTIYRDIDALCGAGIPIYTEYGAKGGFALTNDYTTDLTGLNTDELLSLLLLDNTSVVSRLGLGQTLSSALRKLTSALPATQREKVEWYRQRVFIDSEKQREKLSSRDTRSEILSTLQDAVFHGKMVELKIAWPRPDQGGIYLISPIGIVESQGSWFLAAGLEDFIRIYPLNFISEATITDRTFVRPESFDLPAFWAKWKDGMNRSKPKFSVKLAISPEIAKDLDSWVSEKVLPLANDLLQRDDGKIVMDVTFPSLFSARSYALTHGSAVEVLGSEELRRTIVDFAAQTKAIYHHNLKASP